MNLTEKLSLRAALNACMRKGVRPKIAATLIENAPRSFTARELSDRVSCSPSAAKRAADALVLGRFVSEESEQPNRYWISTDSAARWLQLLVGRDTLSDEAAIKEQENGMFAEIDEAKGLSAMQQLELRTVVAAITFDQRVRAQGETLGRAYFDRALARAIAGRAV
jgi:hypothetical protein